MINCLIAEALNNAKKPYKNFVLNKKSATVKMLF